MSFTVAVNQFEGPLDLMLHLIKEKELDLFDLDIHVPVSYTHLDVYKRQGPGTVCAAQRRTGLVDRQPLQDALLGPGLVSNRMPGLNEGDQQLRYQL